MLRLVQRLTSWYTVAMPARWASAVLWNVRSSPSDMVTMGAPTTMFAVLSRFDRSWEEAARDLGASRWQIIRLVVIPVLAPGIVAVALFGFTLSYDEFSRTLQTSGSLNTLPVEIWTMTLNVTSPSLYSLGTVTTIVSFLIIGLCLGSIAQMQKRRAARKAEE